MTFTQLTELIKHIEEEHNFFNRKNGQLIVKSLTPVISLRSAGVVTAIDIQGYGWSKKIDKQYVSKEKTSMFITVMDFLDTSEDGG